MSEALEESKNVFIQLATEGLKLKYGDSVGKAYAFLLFGGYGIPGIIPDAEMITAASLSDDPNKVAEQFTQEAAANFVIDFSRLILSEALKKAGIELTPFASQTGLIFGLLLAPSKLGDGTLPPQFIPSPSPPPAIPQSSTQNVTKPMDDKPHGGLETKLNKANDAGKDNTNKNDSSKDGSSKSDTGKGDTGKSDQKPIGLPKG